MIVNGATKHDDMKHLDAQLASFKGDVKYQYFHEQQLIALQVPATRGAGQTPDQSSLAEILALAWSVVVCLQGPSAAAALQALVPHVDLSKVPFMVGLDTHIKDFKVRAKQSRGGGELMVQTQIQDG